MPIPAPNLYPPFNIVRLSHVELVVTDLGWARQVSRVQALQRRARRRHKI